jgi:hypothetical protein
MRAEKLHDFNRVSTRYDPNASQKKVPFQCFEFKDMQFVLKSITFLAQIRSSSIASPVTGYVSIRDP